MASFELNGHQEIVEEMESMLPEVGSIEILGVLRSCVSEKLAP